MNSQDLKNRISDFCRLLEMTEDAFDYEKIKDEDDFIAQAIQLFKENHQIYNTFLFKILDFKVRHSLAISYHLEKFTPTESIESIFPYGERLSRIRKLETETGILFPRLVLSKTSLFFQFALLIFPGILFIGLLLTNIELVIALQVFSKISILLGLIVVPYLIIYFLFPKFFQPSKLLGVNTYKELINDLVLMNRYYYVVNNYKLTSIELRNIIGSNILRF